MNAPRHSPAAALLTSPAFVVAVAVLAVNDHLLKPAFGNWVTGKLSDVAGLFAFALFCMAFAPRRRTLVTVLVSTAWLAWKSPLADAPLVLWNAHVPWPLTRVVDYGDWIALGVLPLAWWMAGGAMAPASHAPVRAWRRAAAVASAMAAVVAFSATTVPSRTSPTTQFVDRPAWTVAATGPEVHDRLVALGFDSLTYEPPVARGNSRAPRAWMTFRIGKTAAGVPVFVFTRLERASADSTRVVLMSAHSDAGRPEEAAIRMLFEDIVMAPLLAHFGGRAGRER